MISEDLGMKEWPYDLEVLQAPSLCISVIECIVKIGYVARYRAIHDFEVLIKIAPQ
jgi:hypothetical protein